MQPGYYQVKYDRFGPDQRPEEAKMGDLAKKKGKGLRLFFKPEYRQLYDPNDPNDKLGSFYPKVLEMDSFAFRSFLIRIFLDYKPARPSDHCCFGNTPRHWYRFTDLCRVCSVNWDFIGKVETVDVDSEIVMEKAGVKGEISLGLHGRSSNNDKVIGYFKGVPKSFVRDLYELYREDYEIFGYGISDWLWVHLSDE